MTSEQVVLQVSLAMSDPKTISISNPHASDSMKLIATIKQSASPFPDRPITLLTTYTALDPCSYGFHRHMMGSPVSVLDEKRVIWMLPIGVRIHWYRPSGDPNIRKFDQLNFLTIPAVGQGEATMKWDMSPTTMFRHYLKETSLEEKLAEFKPGEQFKIEIKLPWIGWWTWGSLDGDLESKKFARWSFPEEVPLQRPSEGDETEEMQHKLMDPVYGHDVNYLNSRSAVEDEEMPNVKDMRANGWVFGEPSDGVNMICEQAALFTFIE